jgi:DNA mismatch repair protein MSH2
MYLDKAAFSALNVLPRPEESLRANTSLLGFLNRCRSAVGTRRLRQWLTQPLTSAKEIEARQDVVEALCSSEELLRQLESQMRHVPDLEKIGSRLHCTGTANTKANKATLEDMVLLHKCVLGTQSMASILGNYQGIHAEMVAKTFTQELCECVKLFGPYCQLVEATIDLKQAEQRTYCINSSFDASLQELGAKRDKVREQMEEVRRMLDLELGLPPTRGEKSVSLVECQEGQGFRVTKKNQQGVQNHKGQSKIKVLSIKKQEIIFTTAALEKLNRELTAAIDGYNKQSAKLAEKALAVAATYSVVVERTSQVLGNLDVLCAFARVVATAPCSFVRPRLESEGKSFTIHGASHVLLVANSEKGFVANDLQMHGEDNRLHLITGPNMGGKSTYIRSIALIALLNQIGSYVPCRSAVLPIFDAIMCRVGASDMQLRGISTFMAEMLEASCILNTATSKSLVIVDELGRGTSTSDGFGIAWAIARHLVEKTGCFTLFATHFHELAALQDAVPGVRNRHATAAVDAASGQLTFLYSLQDGPADQSYGAHVAELAGFPAPVVAAARRRAEEYEAGSGLGRSAKRPRTGEKDEGSGLVPGDAVAYILAAEDEEQFVTRALQELPRLSALQAQ